MKSTVNSTKKTNHFWFQGNYLLLICLGFLIISSCQKDDGNLFLPDDLKEDCRITKPELPFPPMPGELPDIYFGHKIFKRTHGAPVVERVKIANPNFNCFDGKFVLKIKNGSYKTNRVSSAEIWINGELIVRPSDFSKNVSSITKPLSDLTPESIMKVKLNGAPGSFIDLWIEGTMITVTPAFEQIAPLCQNSIAPALPTSSANNPAITGTWNPATIATGTSGKTTYTFTPSEGQCAVTVKMDIEIIATVTPVFAQIGPLFQNSVPPELPKTSNNGIIGTWDPATINTSNTGTFTFIFTPDVNQCANVTTMKIEVTNIGTVSDNEGNVYKTIKIGDQWWMAENLKITRYNNGDLIGTTIPATLDISGETTPEYQWAYDGNETNATTYGRLYTWYTVADSRGVCPTGWHVPIFAEFTALTDFLINNGYGYGGSGPYIAKSLASKTGWAAAGTPGNVGNDQESNNSSGYNVLPGGVRLSNGVFSSFGEYTGYWSSTETDATSAIGRALLFNISYVTGGSGNKKNGAYIRCIKN